MTNHQTLPDGTSPQRSRPLRKRIRLKASVVETGPPATLASLSPPVVEFLTPREAAELLRLSAVTLARWRIEGRGPEFRIFGRRVVYARGELMVWAAEQARTSTSNRPR